MAIHGRFGPGPKKMLRLATEKDCRAVYEIFMDSSVNPYIVYDPMPIDRFTPIFTQMIDGDGLLVYEDNGRILATCKVDKRSHKLRHVAYIGNLAVRPTHQGNGIGTMIMNTVLDRLKEEGFKRIELFVAQDNERSVRFFESFGFVAEGKLRNFFTRIGSKGYYDALLMAKLYE